MIRYLLLLASLLLLLACSDSDNSEPPAELVEFKPTLHVDELWSVDTGTGVEQLFLKLYPLILDDRIIVTDRLGTVTAYNIENGDILWQTPLDTVVSGGVGGDANHLVISGRDGTVYLLDGKGQLTWKVDVASEILSPAIIAANQLILRSVDGKIFALSLEDGSENWVFKRDVPALSLRGNSIPLLKQNYLFAGLDNGRLVVLDILDGRLALDTAISTPTGRSELERLVDIDGDSVISGDTLYMGTYQGRVVSMDIRRGQLNWSRKLSTYNGLVHSSSGLFISDDKDHIWALDASNGATLWKQEKLQARKITRPVAIKNTLVVGDYAGYLHWLSPFDGHFLQRTEMDDSGILLPPMVHKGRLYVLSREGKLSAFSIKTE